MSYKNEGPDLELVFNLQWRPNVGAGSNIVCVYDVPSTTLNDWETFKSYLLKNSGNPDDLKVSYLENGKEFPIESTLDFQTALYYFRKKAMRGEITNLKLERLLNRTKSRRFSPTCDAQTECSYDNKMERAPEWFVSYMAEFKKDILNEVVSAVTTHAAVMKPSVNYSHYPRKSKTEFAKKCRKNHHLDGNEKEVLKTMKLEKKLESKMEKLVNKSKKLEKKKISLITKSSDSDAGHSSSKSNSETVTTVDVTKMNAAPLRYGETHIPHLMGGEVYRHSWNVINNGSMPWTDDTELHFSWGSSLLEPIEKVVTVPLLNPGEIGDIEALIHVPRICGRYQMYWHFHHKGRRFGHWLGCEIVVDQVNCTEPISTSFLRSLTSRYDIPAPSSKINPEFKTTYDSLVDDKVIPTTKDQTGNDKNSISTIEDKMNDLEVSGKNNIPSEELANEKYNPEIEEVVIHKSPSKIQIIENYFNDIDPTRKVTNIHGSVESLIENEILSNHNNDGGDSHSESISKIDEDTSSNSTLNDMVMVNFPDVVEEQDVEGYAYVLIDGIKTPVPKRYLRADYLETAEEAPEPKKEDSPNCVTSTDNCYGMKCEVTDIVEHRKNIPDDDDYDDIPDLVPSEYVAEKLCASSKESEIDMYPRHSVSSEYHAGYEVIIQNTCGKPYSVEEHNVDHQFIQNGDNSRTITSEQSLFVNPFHPHYQNFCNEEKKMVHPTPYEYGGNVNLYPTFDSNDLLPHVPNYQQTPPELRLKSKSSAQENFTEQSRNTYSSNPEMIPITNIEAVSDHLEGQTIPECFPSASGSNRLRSVPEASPPISSVVSEAMTMASSALKTVVNKIIPSKNEMEAGVWINGHWVPTAENSIRENNLKILADMGFKNRDLNATLLARYDDDIRRVVAELVI